MTAAAGWLVTARRAADPVLPLRLFRTRSIAIPTAVSVLVGFALFGTISYLPAFLQVARGASATQAGLVVTALMAGVLITTTASGRNRKLIRSCDSKPAIDALTSSGSAPSYRACPRRSG